jgi:hypothetical protein
MEISLTKDTFLVAAGAAGFLAGYSLNTIATNYILDIYAEDVRTLSQFNIWGVRRCLL